MIKTTKHHYPQPNGFGGWENSANFYHLYRSTDIHGVEKEFLDAKKAWAHYRKDRPITHGK